MISANTIYQSPFTPNSLRHVQGAFPCPIPEEADDMEVRRHFHHESSAEEQRSIYSVWFKGVPFMYVMESFDGDSFCIRTITDVETFVVASTYLFAAGLAEEISEDPEEHPLYPIMDPSVDDSDIVDFLDYVVDYEAFFSDISGSMAFR